MTRHGTRNTARGIGAVLVVAAALCGCSENGGTSGHAAKAASAAASVASQAASALASATAAAGNKLNEIKGGADARSDARLGTVSTDADGHKAVQVTVTNPTSQTRKYAVQVNFDDPNGNLLDTVVVTVDGVAAGASKNAGAVSNRKLSGDVKPDVARAVRY